jgi:hypothetical protein
LNANPVRWYVGILTALWAALGIAGVLTWIAVRWRTGMPVVTPQAVAALAADLLLASLSATWLYRLAGRWAARHLGVIAVLGRVALTTLALLIATYLLTVLAMLAHGRELTGLGRSILGLAIDWSLFWAIALTVVPIPFIKVYAHRPAALQTLEVRSTGAVEYVPVCDLLGVIAAENYVELVLPRRSVLHRATLTQMIELLGSDFVRVHRSALVRRSAIAGLERNAQRQCLRLTNGRQVALSRAYRWVVGRHAIE